MRMRRKKHLEERLAAVADYLYICDGEDRNFNTAICKKEYIEFDKYFGRTAPLYLEIGCGKGKFAIEYAKRHPEINLLAVEKDSNVIVSACEKAIEENVCNLRFLKCSAEYLEKYIPEKSVSRIFLNFSSPFPKNKYETHRLTSDSFLKIYARIMAPGGEIHQKTDNMHFFEYSLERYSQNGYALNNLTLDLDNSGFEGNIRTEYEQKFVAQGLPIYRVEAYIK